MSFFRQPILFLYVMNQRKLEGNNMNTLQERIQDEINELSVNLQKEVFDFIY